MRTKEKMLQWGIIMITKSKKFYVSFFMAIMMFLSCLIPTIGVLSSEKTAFADEGVQRTKVYYITDYAGSDEIEQEIISQTSLTSNPLTVERKYYPREMLQKILEEDEEIESANPYVIEEFFQEVAEVSDAYVIFEMRWAMTVQVIPEDGSEPKLTENLSRIFSILHEDNNCKIMFICGTDESRFGQYTNFLDYVDIHVNTDIFYLYVAAIFGRIKSACGSEQWQNVTFIFDESMVTVDAEGGVKSWFLESYFYLYIRAVYRDRIENGMTQREIFEMNDIKIVCHATDEDRYPNRFYDIVQGDYFDWEEDQKRIENERIYALGATWNDDNSTEPYSLQWTKLIQNLCPAIGMKDDRYEIFIYNDARHDFTEFQEPGVYTAYTVNDVNYVILPFVTDDVNMARFDNWKGRCAITHKPLDPYENGWLGEGEIEIDMSGWQYFMTQEDYDYFFRHGDDGDTAWPR